MGSQNGHLFVAQPALQGDRFGRFGVIEQAPKAAPVLDADIDQAGNLVDRLLQVFDPPGLQFKRVGRNIFSNDDAIAIDNQTAGRRNRDQLDPVLLGLQVQLVMAHDLEPDKPSRQDRKADENQSDRNRDPDPEAMQLLLRVAHSDHVRGVGSDPD